jgi:phytoene/squalene synthetase
MLHAWRTEGAQSVCTARLAGAVNHDTIDAARHLGLARGLACIVRDFDEERLAGRLRIPASLLQEIGVEAESLLAQSPPAETRRALLKPILALARDHYRRGLKPCTDRSTLRASALLAALGMKSAERHTAREGRGSPGPLKRLIAVWRAARRESGLDIS